MWCIGVFAGQISFALPRRFGYAPFTLAAMAVAAFVSAPMIRRRFGDVPVKACAFIVAWLWLSLVAVCIPAVREEDQRIWSAVARALPNSPNILFVNADHHYNSPNFQVGTGLRSRPYPEVFESEFSDYWWMSQYARIVLGAAFTAFRAEDDGPNLRLFSNGLNRQAPFVSVARDKIMVLIGTSPRWDEFRAAIVPAPKE